MRRLTAFEQVSLDGFFCDAKNDMSWAHKDDPEWNEFSSSNASGDGVLLFGRVTFEMMASFWPTPAGREANRVVAEAMNRMPKFVFSRKLENPSWKNTTVLKGDPATEVRKLKNESGPGLAIMGSGTIVSALTDAGLIDEFQIVVNPIILGKGRTLFETVRQKVALERVKTRTFENGNVVLYYERAA